MTPLELNNQFGVALMSVIGTLVLRKLGVTERAQAVLPVILCVSLFWLFVDLPDARGLLIHGLVSGLLASGILYVIQGLTLKR